MPGNVSLSLFTFLSSNRVFFSDFLIFFFVPCCWLPSPFYSVIPRVRGPIDSPPLLPWVPEPVMCLSPSRLILFLFFIISSFWFCFFESPWLTFHSRAYLGSSSCFLVFPSFSPFQTQLLVVLSFSFFPNGQNPFLLGWRFSLLPPFITPHFGFLRIPGNVSLPFSTFLSSDQVFFLDSVILSSPLLLAAFPFL